MLKKLFVLMLAIAPLAVVAQELKVAYINTSEVFGQMPELKEVESKLATKQEEIKKTLTAIETEYNKKSGRVQGF